MVNNGNNYKHSYVKDKLSNNCIKWLTMEMITKIHVKDIIDKIIIIIIK